MKINNVNDAMKLFELHSLKQFTTFENGDYKSGNKSYKIVMECIVYLFQQQKMDTLRVHLTHENPYVREMAAFALLPFKQKECIIVLNELIKGHYKYVSVSAETLLEEWKGGTLVFPYEPRWGKPVKPEEKNHQDALKKSDIIPLWIQQISDICGCIIHGKYDLRAEKKGLYILYDSKKKELEVRINTFINPYVQNIGVVYHKRLDLFRHLGIIVNESKDLDPTGFQQIMVIIPKKQINKRILRTIMDKINLIRYEEEKNLTEVFFQVEYNTNICYFKTEWWMPVKAVIKMKFGYERFDFKDESKYDKEIWDFVTGDFDRLMFSESFKLISPQEFKDHWEATNHIHQAKPF